MTAGYVYLAIAGAYHKIGKAIDPQARVACLRHTLGKPRLVHAITTPDSNALERLLHGKFDAKRAGGEWFKLDADDVALVCSLGECDPERFVPEWLKQATPVPPPTRAVASEFRTTTGNGIKLDRDTYDALKSLASKNNRPVGRELVGLVVRHLEREGLWPLTPDKRLPK